MTRLLPLALLLGCRNGGPSEGTSVGNPTELTLSVAPSADLLLDAAQVDLSLARFADAQGGFDDVNLDASVDLLAGGTVTIPDLEWSTLELFFASPMALSGSTSGDAAARVTLEVESLLLTAAVAEVVFDGGSFVLELGSPGWLDAESIGYEPDEELLVEPGDAVHDTLAELVQYRSSLIPDQDGDREVSDDERDAAVATSDRDREPGD